MTTPESPDPYDLNNRQVPFLDHINVEPLESGEGTAAFRLTVDDHHLRTLGILHGGVTATLLDTAMGFAAGTLSPPDHHVVTVQLNINYIRPSWKGETLLARGEVMHSGRQTAVARGDLRTDDDTLVATSTATFMFIPRPSES